MSGASSRVAQTLSKLAQGWKQRKDIEDPMEMPSEMMKIDHGRRFDVQVPVSIPSIFFFGGVGP
jgi:hypothetical protein